MKTLEERAEELLKKHKRDYDRFGTDVYDDSEIISLMQAYAKAKLEEAAGNLDKLKAGDSNKVATSFNAGLEVAKQLITETPLD